MLTDKDFQSLIKMIKQIRTKENTIPFPQPGKHLKIEVEDENRNENFIIDVNRKGASLKITKCTFQTRHLIPIIRIDIDGPPHPNPDGTIIPCPHIHLYKEGYNLRIAYPLEKEMIADTNNLLEILIRFLEYNSISNINDYTYEEQGGII